MQQILLTIQCVSQGSAGFRCVTRIFGIIRDTLSLSFFPVPAFSTARDWLLKLGLFNLTKPCEAGEWVWIVDCSIQMGAMKCLLIIGVRMDALKRKKDFKLSHADVEPIVLKTVESCRGEVIKMALDEAKKRTRGAVAIVSDEGPELKRGVRLFQEDQIEGKKPLHLHDIMHKADLVLKKELQADVNWENFIKEMTNTTQQLKQSSSSHLIPPKQYQKKRRMRSEIDIIEWGITIINYLDSSKDDELEKEKLSWVLKYRFQLAVYQEMVILFDITTEEVREHGYSDKTIKVLEEKGKSASYSDQSRSFFSKLLEVVRQEVNKIPEGSCILGCSEIIESIFGKFKQLEKQHASGGLTSLVLSVPSFLGNVSESIVKIAMEQISIDKVKEWIKTNLGHTFWSRRRSDLNMSEGCLMNNYLEPDDQSCVRVS